VLATVLLLAAACKRPEARPGVDRPLVIVLSPAHAPRNPESLRASLERASGLRLELRVAASSDEAIGLVQARRAEAGLLPLFDYLYCAEVFKVQPLVQLLRHGKQVASEGDLVVRSDSQLRELRQLRGLEVAFVDRYSVTGFLLPAKLLRDAAVEVKPAWLGSHDAVLEAVRSSRYAAGATYRGLSAGKPELRVLAQTPAVANEPVFVQAQLPADILLALQRAFLSLGSDAPVVAGLADVTGFGEVTAGTYETALATVRAAGRKVEDMIPGGWARANEHRRPLWSYAP